MTDVPPHFASHTGPLGAPGGGGGAQTPNKPTYSKRGKITIVACVPCRRRKTKCDGRRPTCSQCSSRETPCSYDMNEEQRRLTFLRENVEVLAEEKATLEGVLWNLKTTSETEATEILRRIRSGAEYGSLAQQIQAGRSLAQVKGDYSDFSSTSSLDGEDPFACLVPHHKSSFLSLILSADTTTTQKGAYERLIQAIATGPTATSEELVQRLRRREPIERIMEAATIEPPPIPQHTAADTMDIDSAAAERLQTHVHARPMRGNALAPDRLGMGKDFGRAPNAHTPPRVRSQADAIRWTTVTEDQEFVQHLLDVYFTWQHTFFQNFPEHLFRRDFEQGGTKYCARVLVNAICAAGCLLSSRPEARADPLDPSTAGAGFFEEGMVLLNQSDRSSIPSTAGLFILSHVEGYRAKLGAMWGLVGRSARMTMDLQLHLRNESVVADMRGSEEQMEEAARIHAFWGCFVSDQ